MALGFFRRNQKLVFVIMVVLMVAFLIPTSIKSCGERNELGTAIGEAGGQKITVGMRMDAKRDLDVLERLQIGWRSMGKERAGNIRATQLLQYQPLLALRIFTPSELAFDYFIMNNPKPDINWAILMQEAQEMNIKVPDAQVEQFMAAKGLTGEGLQQVLAQLGRDNITEKDIRRAVASYLMVMEAFMAGRTEAPPSLNEIRHAVQQTAERIDLAMVAFRAADYIKDLPDPTPAQVQAWFDKYRTLIPGDPRNQDPLGFGLYQPAKAEVAYLFVDSNLVAQAAEDVSPQAMEAYWNAHQDELTIEVPASRPSTGPAGEETPEVTTVKPEKFSQAKPEIRRLLKAQVAEIKASALMVLAQDIIAKQGPGAAAYQKAYDLMVQTAPAEKLLARKVGELPIKAGTLETVIEELGKSAGVRIVYPFGKHETVATTTSPATTKPSTFELQGDIKVEVPKDWAGKTLGAVLDEIAAKHSYPKFKWATCEGFAGTIFPTEPVNMIPLRQGDAGMLGLQAINDDALLGSAYQSKEPNAANQRLVIIIQTALAPKQAGRRETLITPGSDYPLPMFVLGEKTGRLLWRLVATEPEQAPEKLTDDIRKDAIQQMKLNEGLSRALKAAQALKDRLGDGDLEAVASADKLTVMKTGMFARRGLDGQPTTVKGVGQDPLFIEQAFKLAPANPEPPYPDTPAELISLPRQRVIYVAQRIGFEPVVNSEFAEKADQTMLVTAIVRGNFERQAWFNPEYLERRTNWRPEKPD